MMTKSASFEMKLALFVYTKLYNAHYSRAGVENDDLDLYFDSVTGSWQFMCSANYLNGT